MEKEESILPLFAVSMHLVFMCHQWLYLKGNENAQLEIGAPSGSVVEISDSGYINSELFVTWLKYFHSHVKSTKENPVVILHIVKI